MYVNLYDIIDSVIVKLYFFDAVGMENFELLDKAHYPYTKKIKAFKVNWKALNKAES